MNGPSVRDEASGDPRECAAEYIVRVCARRFCQSNRVARAPVLRLFLSFACIRKSRIIDRVRTYAAGACITRCSNYRFGSEKEKGREGEGRGVGGGRLDLERRRESDYARRLYFQVSVRVNLFPPGFGDDVEPRREINCRLRGARVSLFSMAASAESYFIFLLDEAFTS